MNFIINRDGRYSALKTTADPLSPENLLLIEKLFKESSSEFLSDLSKIPYKLRECYRHELDNKLDKDPFYICIESKKFWSVWQNARQYRITGSRCYAIYKNMYVFWRYLDGR